MKKVFALCLFSTVSFFMFGEVTWNIAATTFKGTVAGTQKKLDKAAQEIVGKIDTSLPQLLLDNLQNQGVRTVNHTESIARVNYSLAQERVLLFNNISDALASKDSLLFTAVDERTLKKQQREQDKRIAEARKNLAENLKNQKKPIHTLVENLNRKNKIPFTFSSTYTQKNTSTRTVTTNEEEIERWNILPQDYIRTELWNNDSFSLFEAKTAEESEIAFERRVLKEEVACLISGEYFLRDEFIRVKLQLNFFPRTGNKLIDVKEVVDVGSILDIEDFVNNLADQVIPEIMNVKPVRIRFTVTPDSVKNDYRVSVDGISVNVQDNEIFLSPAIHTISITAQSFKSTDFTYDFVGASEFNVDVELQQENSVAINIDTMGRKGELYLNALPEKVHNNDPNRGNVVIGEFKDEDGLSTYFMGDTGSVRAEEVAYTRIKPANESIKNQIEKTRKGLYWAYGGLLLSLPFTFTTIGNRNQVSNLPDWEKWRNLETISGITTGVFAANFVGWLIAYLVTANKVIPQEIKFSHKPLPELKVREKPSKIKAEKKAAKEQAKAEKAAKKAAKEGITEEGTPPTDGEMPATIDEQTTLETSEGTSPPEEEKTVAEDVELIIKENAQ
ncbi:MAG: hypothetical protein IIW10_04310 [Spirochaetaceae bacterium]|nr:hypothetical protein [Spirochaetaceae bacterium]